MSDGVRLTDASGSPVAAGGDRTPPTSNPPGLDAVAYRIGTHATFLRRMLDALPDVALRSPPRRGAGGEEHRRWPLRGLTTRRPDDFSVALLDAFAAAGDVLAFYQERVANEGFLRTATERRSVLELARTIGYELAPGVAAQALLAFDVDTAPEAPRHARIATGLKVSSVPGQDELPQTFETVEEAEVRAEWNAMRPRQRVPQVLGRGDTQAWIEGVDAALQPGDRLLLVGTGGTADLVAGAWDLRAVRSVEPDAAAGRTLVRWGDGLRAGVHAPGLFVLRRQAAIFGAAAPEWRMLGAQAQLRFLGREDADAVTVKAEAEDRATTTTEDDQTVIRRTTTTSSTTTAGVPPAGDDAETTRAGDDAGTRPAPEAGAPGSAAPAPATDSVPDEWPGFVLIPGAPLDLDGPYPDVLPEGFVVLQAPEATRAYRVSSSTTLHQSAFGIVATTTRLELSPSDLTMDGDRTFPRRGTVVFAGSERLALAEVPDPEPVAGDRIDLEHAVPPLAAGRIVVVGGKLAEAPPGEEPETAGEAVVVETVAGPSEPAIVLRGDGLTRRFRRDTVTVQGNVVRATHGETMDGEIVGSGNGALANQRFSVRRPPVTHLRSPAGLTPDSTLVVRVNGVEWRRVPSLFRAGPTDQAYTARTEDDGSTTIIFGDGTHGARLPTGRENVVATYRSGAGPEGEVRAGQLTLLASKPLGVRGVTNPLGAAGAAPPEARDHARASAPLGVVTLDRAVSLRDFEAAARAYPGVGKAQAAELWDGHGRIAHVTVATAGGDPAPPDLLADLTSAVRAVGDPVQPLRAQGFERRRFELAASVDVAPERVRAEVLAGVREALEGYFTFDRRDFAQPVTAAEVVQVAQSVPGVRAVRLDRLAFVDSPREAERAVAALAAAPAVTAAGATDLGPLRPAPAEDAEAAPAAMTAFHWVLPAATARSLPRRDGGWDVFAAELLQLDDADLAVEAMDA